MTGSVALRSQVLTYVKNVDLLFDSTSTFLKITQVKVNIIFSLSTILSYSTIRHRDITQ